MLHRYTQTERKFGVVVHNKKTVKKKSTYDFAPIQATQNSSTLRIRIATEDGKLITALMPFL